MEPFLKTEREAAACATLGLRVPGPLEARGASLRLGVVEALKARGAGPITRSLPRTPTGPPAPAALAQLR